MTIMKVLFVGFEILMEKQKLQYILLDIIVNGVNGLILNQINLKNEIQKQKDHVDHDVEYQIIP